MNVLVVTPTYNERENIEAFVKAVCTALPNTDVLIVDDNSPDGTGALAEALATADSHVQVLHRKR
ncbi:MAG: glycosyltransferase, partial [Kiritimatiellia bacterium]